MEQHVVQVVIPGIRKPLSYTLTEALGPATLGSEVIVELGRREVSGWVVSLGADSSFEPEPPGERQGELFASAREVRRLKEVRALHPAFLQDQMPLFEWMASYYGVPLAEVLANALPSREEAALEQYLFMNRDVAAQWKNDPRPLEDKFRRAKSQWKILQTLLQRAEEANWAGIPKSIIDDEFPDSSRLLGVLQEKGCLERTFGERRVPAITLLKSAPRARESLTEGQLRAEQQIEAALDRRSFSCLLLFGVTGSGKTEVYLRAIEKVLGEGGGALVIVPEIALTPQLYDQFESRLGEPIALLHSEVGKRSRWQSWEGLLRGNLRVAIGARSAVFAPVKNLRLIIVDEEHESSYKQSDGLRYHARDVAVMRAKLLSGTIVLGSATPSFESLINASQGRYQLVTMPNRVSDRTLPSIEVVDLNKIRKRDMPSPSISPQLFASMQDALTRGGQVVILFNRRGFAAYLQCVSCQEVVGCPNCSIAMTYHKRRDRLLCHYCNESLVPPRFCAKCRDPRTTAVDERENSRAAKKAEKFGELELRGSGTEHLVEEIQELFPAASIERMDRDTVGKKDSYRRILGKMRTGEANVLVGTQMIAKGHDLPGVTVVGIIDADVGLHAPDFRSSEKTFQLITQASGRAGRGSEPGKVIIQTRQPKHPTIVATQTNRFKAFARYELEFRKQLQYPPHGRLMRLVISSTDSQEAYRAAMTVKEVTGELIESLASRGAAKLLGPAPAPHERLRGRFRWHILIKSQSATILSALADALDRWKDSVNTFNDFRLTIDVDPVEML